MLAERAFYCHESLRQSAACLFETALDDLRKS